MNIDRDSSGVITGISGPGLSNQTFAKVDSFIMAGAGTYPNTWGLF